MKIFKFNLPLYLVLILVCGAFAGGKYILGNRNYSESSQLPTAISCPASMEQIRLKSYQLTHPLILTDVNEESGALTDIQAKIQAYINQAKTNQKAEEVSVYFRKLDGGSWFTINPNTTYNPASMIKVAYLITYMKMAESNPRLLKTKLFFAKHFSQSIPQNIKDFQLKEGRDYTIEELLSAMITHSDNDATILLNQNLNLDIFNGIFTDLNIPVPNPVTEYYITAGDFNKFFRILYSSSYTRPEYSEYALQLLTTSTYNQGLKRGIDNNVVVAHKFGERIIGNTAQLHEFGIVFYNKSPYLIGVMTKGSSLDQLSDIIGDISKIAFDNYKLIVNS